MDRYDLVVIGAGPGGYPAAITAAREGLKVALIEAGEVGGTCLNRGCIPSKALIAGAELFHSIQKAEEFGIEVGKVSIDYSKLVKRQKKIVSGMRKGLEQLIKSHGVELLKGFATFQSPREIKVKGEKSQTIYAEKAIIATGSEPRMIPAFPCDHERILDSTSLLNLEKLPKSLIVIGGGVIGCEFASLFHNLGLEVTILELLPSLLPMECQAVQEAITRAYKRRKIAVHTGEQVEQAVNLGKEVEVKIKGKKPLKAEMALVAVGRRMNTDQIGLEKAGVSFTKNGMIEVNQHMETSADGIFAIGDPTSSYWLAHVATHQGIVAAKRAVGIEASMHYDAIPSVIFTDPEVATVGLSLEKAEEQGYSASIGSFPFRALGKGQAEGHTEGFAQVVIDRKTHQILGAQVVGHSAATMIAQMAQAITNELTVECVIDTIHAHPTFSEVWPEALLMAIGQPLHLPPIKRK